MPSASKTIVQLLLVASAALAVKAPAHSPSRGQMLLQVSANAQLRSFVEPFVHSARDTGMEPASLVEMLRHAKDAAHDALEAGGSADRNATQAAWAQDMIDTITNDIVPGIFADHKLDQARLNDTASKINNCLTSLQDTNETTLAPGMAGASSDKAELEIQTKVLEDMNATSLMLCNATHTRLASHTCILPALVQPDEMASYMDCVEKWLLESQTLHTRCDDAHSNFSAQEKFANGLFQNYTLRSCSIASDTINACGVYTACRVEHDSDFTQVAAAAKTSASGRMTEMQALKKVACFLEVARMSPAELATDAGASKFSSCEREEDTDAEDLTLVFPSISTAIVCPQQTVAATGCVRRPGCEFGAPVFITSVSQQHLLENPDGSIGLGSTRDAAAQWTLSDAGHGTVLISSHSGKHLQDLEGAVTLDRNLQAGEQWTLQATGTGEFLVSSHNGQHLQDFEGILLDDEVHSAGKWTIVLEDGTPACLALPAAETTLPGQTQAPTPEMTRGQSTPSPDTSVVTSTMSTTAMPTTAVPTTAAPTVEAVVQSNKYLELSAADFDGSMWSDHNNNGKAFRPWRGEPPTKMQIDGIPVVRFNRNSLISAAAYQVPQSLTIFAVVKWNGIGGPWDTLMAVSHDKYWSFRHHSTGNEFNMHVRNEQEPRIGHELYKFYVVVGRVDDTARTSYLRIDELFGDGTQSVSVGTAGIPGGGHELIALGQSTKTDSEWMNGDLAHILMYDKALSDQEIEHTVAHFKRTSEAPTDDEEVPVPLVHCELTVAMTGGLTEIWIDGTMHGSAPSGHSTMRPFPSSASLIAIHGKERDGSPATSNCVNAYWKMECSCIDTASPWHGLTTDSSWKKHEGSEVGGWTTSGFDDSAWQNSYVHPKDAEKICGFTKTGDSEWFFRKRMNVV